MRRLRYLVALLAITAAVASTLPAAGAVEISLPVVDQAPWGYIARDNNRQTGILVELVRELARRTQSTDNIDLLPRRRMLMEQFDPGRFNAAALAAAVPIPAHFEPIGLLVRYQVMLVARRGLAVATVEDFKGRSVSAVESLATLIPTALTDGYSTNVVSSINEGMRMLAAGRTDGLYVSAPSFQLSLDQLQLSRDSVGPSIDALEIRTSLHVDRNGPLYPLRDRLRAALDDMHADGTVARITFARYSTGL